MKNYFIFTVILFVFNIILSEIQAEPLPTAYSATLIKVIDGDTIKLRLEVYPDLFKEVNLRVAGIDTPESRAGTKNGYKISQCEIALGKQAKEHAKIILKQNSKLIVTNIDPSKTKYAGRINGQLWFSDSVSKEAPPLDYALYMVREGFAKVYDGGRREPWPCN